MRNEGRGKTVGDGGAAEPQVQNAECRVKDEERIVGDGGGASR